MRTLICVVFGFFALATTSLASQTVRSVGAKHLEAHFYVKQGSGLKEVPAATSAVKTIDICGAGAQLLTKAVLWMPDHGHGSSPTTLTVQGDHCMRVNNVEFIMKGSWEIRYRFSDSDRAVQVVKITH